MYARTAVNVPTISGTYDYSIPQHLEGRIGLGHLVTVPFGNQTAQGVVLQLVPEPAVQETKSLLDQLDPQPVLTPAQIALAEVLSRETLNPLAACLGLMLPVGLSRQADVLYTLLRNPDKDQVGEAGTVKKRLVDLLVARGPMRARQIDRHFSRVDWRKTAQFLVRSGVLSSSSVLPPPAIRSKFIRTVQLSVPPEAAQASMPDLGRTSATLQRRQTALRCLIREPQALDVAWVYAESGCNLADLQELSDRELVVLQETEIWRDPLVRISESGMKEASLPPELTPDQAKAWQEISRAFASPEKPKEFLLHGVTGSGKTELYIRAAQECVRHGRQVLVLVPEIALTPQTVLRFLARFPGQVGLVHSRLSEGERYDTWRRARLGHLKVVIGPRSALFTPLPDIGLIVLDECHDGSYHQSEPPFYHAVAAAQAYAKLCGAVCILGSATPTIVQRHHSSPPAEPNSHCSVRLELPQRIGGIGLPPVSVVDMREELKSGGRGIFSRKLVNALGDILSRGQQAILFLNRRGTATYVFCRECGNTLKCPNCDTPLTLHIESPSSQSGGSLTCHRCGYTRKMPKTCPQCGGNQIRAYGLGSEKVEAELKEIFPAARTLRWDWDTTRHKGSHEIILAHFTAHRADVLVGTQMLAKGLDLPLVTLVGIVLADQGLNLPDPFAGERLFDLLTQVAGRAGRSSLGGGVVLQTFQPEHYVIAAAAQHDYAGFYQRELEERRRLGYPPFNRLVRLEYRSLEAAKAESAARIVAQKLSSRVETENRRETDLIGPVPSFFSRLDGWYRWQVMVRGPDPVSLIRDMKLDGWRVEVDPVSLL